MAAERHHPPDDHGVGLETLAASSVAAVVTTAVGLICVLVHLGHQRKCLGCGLRLTSVIFEDSLAFASKFSPDTAGAHHRIY